MYVCYFIEQNLSRLEIFLSGGGGGEQRKMKVVSRYCIGCSYADNNWWCYCVHIVVVMIYQSGVKVIYERLL